MPKKTNTTNPDWEQDLRSLQPDWNSYGGKPITEEAIAGMKKLLKLLSTPGWVVPLSDGGLQIEWHGKDDFDVEIEIGPDGKVFYD